VSTAAPPVRPTAPDPDLIPCGLNLGCKISLNERCVAGIRCECPFGMGRRSPGLHCIPVIGFQLPLRVIRRQQTPLSWASAYGDPNNPTYIEIVDAFDHGVSISYIIWLHEFDTVLTPLKSQIGQSMNSTRLANSFIFASTDTITHPRLYNASWNDGLMFNFTVYFTPGTVQAKEAWQELLHVIQQNNFEIGHSGLFIDAFQIDPFGGCNEYCYKQLVKSLEPNGVLFTIHFIRLKQN